MFFEGIYVDNKEIVQVKYNPVIAQLARINEVRLSDNWRKGRDSNPRPTFVGTAFRERYFRPLRHPSIFAKNLSEENQGFFLEIYHHNYQIF